MITKETIEFAIEELDHLSKLMLKEWQDSMGNLRSVMFSSLEINEIISVSRLAKYVIQQVQSERVE